MIPHTHNPESLKGLQNVNFTTIGIVEDTNDPAQLGRLKVYCPSIDHEDHNVDDLPWTMYASPFGGTIKNMKVGPEEDTLYGPTTYGIWAVPKQGATVLVQFLNGNTNYRVWTACLYPAMSNRGMPGGRGYDITQSKPYPPGPFSDSYEEMQPAKRNLAEAGLDKQHYFTRGGYERQVAQANTDKDGSDGYAKNPNKTNPKDLDPQGYCIVTPGRHFISMQDQPDFCRVRIKTTTGHQIIMDDTNERIYISTNKGKSWFEMDTDGHIHFYGAASISMTTDADFNVTAVGNINMDAGGSINMKAAANISATAGATINLDAGCSTLVTCGDNFEANASTLANITSGSDLNLKGGGKANISGSQVHLNTAPAATAAKAAKAEAPGIVPEHEPWGRPKSDQERNKYWKA
jgi:phage gp45-like